MTELFSYFTLLLVAETSAGRIVTSNKAGKYKNLLALTSFLHCIVAGFSHYWTMCLLHYSVTFQPNLISILNFLEIAKDHL